MKKIFLALICLLPIPIVAKAYEEAVAVQMGMGFEDISGTYYNWTYISGLEDL